MTKIYRLAERNIAVSSLHDEVHCLLADYCSYSGAPDFAVRTTQAEIDFERDKSAREDEKEGISVRHFPDGYLESLAVCRRIAEKMPEYDTFLFHGSCVAVDGAGYLFTAKSGTGKSTHTRLWREMLGERAVMINDDKPLIRITENGAVVYGTPWDGKHHLSTNAAVPLKAVCLLARSPHNSICEVTPSEAYPALLMQVYRPADSAAMQRTVLLLDRLLSSVSLFRLRCNMEAEAARIAFEAMKG